MSRYDGLIIPRSYSEYINKTDAATLQQALQLPGVLSEVVAAGDNKAVTSNAVNSALASNKHINVYTTSGGGFNNKFVKLGAHEIFILDTLDVNKWIKLIYSTNGVRHVITKVINSILEIKASNAIGTIIIQGGSGNYKAFDILYEL